jgi:CelD/BcsL family acetyltransferase involved in cellulose biosynthesis
MISLTTTDHFDFESTEYRKLLQRAQVTAFQNPEWFTAFYKHLIEDGLTKPLIVVGHSIATNELVMVLPLIRRTEGNTLTVEYAYGGVSDYVCPIIDQDLVPQLDHEMPFHQQLVDTLGPHDVLSIRPVRQVDVGIWETLLGGSPSELHYGSHALQLGSPFQEWRANNLGRNRRSQIDRKARRLAEKGKIELRVLPPDEAAAAINWASRVRQGRFAGDPLQRQDGLNFYCQIASEGAKSGVTRTYQLSCDGNPIATCFGLVDGDRYCYVVLACDYENYSYYSPGVMILDMAMADWAEAGGKVFDFTIGDEPFKSNFRCERTRMFKFTQANSKQGKDSLK